MIGATLQARLDHVAVAVADLDAALDYWQATVGAGLVARETNDGFHSAQVRLSGGGKLEVLASPPDTSGDGFVDRFLARFGPTIHHLTLKVGDLGAALDTVRAGGYDVVDVQMAAAHWREGFLRPSQVGGVIVQVAWARHDDAAWARELGITPTTPTAAAPCLRGVTLAHPDLAAARELWSLLGAEVDGDDGQLVCRWPDSPLDVRIRQGDRAGPVALRLTRALPPAPPRVRLPPVDVA